ncbi:hypothetical protein HGO21_48375 [Acinetobacter sp. CUI P1]|nr:hypothetical protein [Acinetobacter sp. CUI P1]
MQIHRAVVSIRPANDYFAELFLWVVTTASGRCVGVGIRQAVPHYTGNVVVVSGAAIVKAGRADT